MDNLRTVFNYTLNLLNTRLTFAPYSFTVYQYFLALLIMAIVVAFVRKILG